MSISFSFLEKFLIYGPQFITGLSVVLLLAAAVLPDASLGFLRDKIYKTAAAAIFLICVFLFLYTFKTTDIINGTVVFAGRMLILAPGACLFVLLVSPEKGEAGLYGLCLAALACMHAAFTMENSAMIFAAFIAMDCAIFAAICVKKENAEYAAGLIPAKLIYGLACAAFLTLYILTGEKTGKMAAAGCVIFMILFSTPGLLALRGNDAEEGEKFLYKNSAFIMFSGIITAVLITVFISAAAGQVSGRPVIIACVMLACVNIYRTITEEKYQAFAAHDSINAVFLLPALACGAAIPGDEIALTSLLFMLSVFLNNEFIVFHDHGRHTVASLKYGFEKVKGGWLALLGLITGLAAEVTVFILFYKYLKQDPLIFAAVIFMALAFFVPGLNKLFMVLSMLKRFRISGDKTPVFAKGDLRPTLFIIFTAALIAKWLR